MFFLHYRTFKKGLTLNTFQFYFHLFFITLIITKILEKLYKSSQGLTVMDISISFAFNIFIFLTSYTYLRWNYHQKYCIISFPIFQNCTDDVDIHLPTIHKLIKTLSHFTSFLQVSGKLINIYSSMVFTNFLETIKTSLIAHRLVCRQENKFSNSKLTLTTEMTNHGEHFNQLNNNGCKICSKIDLKELRIIPDIDKLKLIVEILITYTKMLKKLNFHAKYNFFEKRKNDECLATLKIILFLLLDKKTNRVGYFINKKLSKNKIYSFNFEIALIGIKDKLTSLSKEEDGNNLILLKHLELDEQFQNLINLFSLFIQYMQNSSISNLKIIYEENEKFGVIHSKIKKKISFLREDSKIKDQVNYYRYLWCYSLIFNSNLDEEIVLDSFDILSVIDKIFTKNSSFILRNERWNLIIKKVPTMFLENYYYNNQELVGRSLINLFPSNIRESESKRIKKLIVNNVENKINLNSVLVDKRQYMRTVEINFVVLPILKGKIFLLSTIKNTIYKQEADNLILFDEHGVIKSVGYLPFRYLAISPALINFYKEKISTHTIFYYEFLQNKISFEFQLDIRRYYFFFKSLFTHESVQEFNEDFLNLVHKEAQFWVKFDLVRKYEERGKENFYLYKMSVHNIRVNNQPYIAVDSYSRVTGNNSVNKAEDIEEIDMGFQIALNQSAYTSSSHSSTVEYLSHIYKSQNANQGKKKSELRMNYISVIIYVFNGFLIILGISFLIYIKSASISLTFVYTALKDVRSLSSLYFNTATHLSNIVILNNSTNYNSLEKGFPKRDQRIAINFTQYFITDITSRVTTYQTNIQKTIQDLENYVSEEFAQTISSYQISYITSDGEINPLPFFDSIKLSCNNYIQLANNLKGKYYYTNVPTININKSLKDQFFNMTNIQAIIIRAVVNFFQIFDGFEQVNKLFTDYFLNEYKSFYSNVFIVVYIFIISHVISVFLSVYDVKLFYEKISKIFKLFSEIPSVNLGLLKNKFEGIKKFLDVENRPSKIIKQLKKEKESFQKTQTEHNKRTLPYKFLKNADNGSNPSYDNDKSHDLSRSKNNFAWKLFIKVIKVILYINSIYLIYCIVCYFVIISSLNRIEVSFRYNFDILEFQRIFMQYFLCLRFSLIINDPSYVIKKNIFPLNEEVIYDRWTDMLDLYSNNQNLALIQAYETSLQGRNLCITAMAAETATNLASLHYMCKDQIIMRSNSRSILSHFLSRLTRMFESYLQSDRTPKSIAKIYFEEDNQFLNYISLFFVRRYITMCRDTLGFTILQNDINNLVLNSIILFSLMIVTEIFNFFLIKKKVVSRVYRTLDNLMLIEKCVFYNLI
jgi:hypothetical protein